MWHLHRYVWAWDDPPPPEYFPINCPVCNGSGLVGELQDCIRCNGNGKLRRRKVIAATGHAECMKCGKTRDT